jgi:terminase small subunit / prophage DNA-packing protein
VALQAEVGAHLFMSAAEVSKLVASGVLPKPAKRGEYDLEACREAYIRHIRAIAARWKAAPADDGEDTPLDLVTERARLASEQADGHAIKNATLRREVLLKPHVFALGAAIIVRFRARILALPTKAAPLIVGMTSLPDIVEKLTELVHEALEELAAFDFSRGELESSGADSDGIGEAGEASAQADDQRMG